mgnify:CR=1 FL=1
MNATTVAVDLAKSVFQLAVADEHWRIAETQRLTRTQFERWFVNRSVDLVVMEACGSAHHWARWLNGLGIEVRLLPAQYVRAYVRRNKTDATDAAALLEAAHGEVAADFHAAAGHDEHRVGHRLARKACPRGAEGDRGVRMVRGLQDSGDFGLGHRFDLGGAFSSHRHRRQAARAHHVDAREHLRMLHRDARRAVSAHRMPGEAP